MLTLNKKPLFVIFITGMLGIMGCTKSSSDSSSASSGSSAVSVSGTLSLSSTIQSMQKLTSMSVNGDSENSVLALSSYSVVCSTSTVPPLSATAQVNTDGTFSLNIDGAVGQPMSCVLIDSDGTKKADFLIKNDSNKDMNGKSDRSAMITPTKDLKMGSVEFDPDSGEVTVSSTSISDSIASTAVSSVFNPTGAWTIGGVDFSLPSGVRSTCTQAESNSGSCNGPPDGQQIYLKLWSGVKTADASPIHGLQVWDSEAGFNACGGKIGLPSSVKSEIGVDFSSNGAADSTFSFATSVTNFLDQVTSTTGTVTLTDNWKMSTATLQHSVNPGCSATDITIGGTSYSMAWKCGPDNASLYQVSLGGGCVVTATSKPVEVQDWSGMTCPSVSIDSNGVRSQTCTGNATVNSVSTAVTCVNKWAVTNSSNTVQTSSGVNFNWTDLNASQLASGNSCSSIANSGSSDSAKLAQLQCYSEYYYRSGLERSGAACLPRVDTDWSSSNPADFVKVNFRPSQMVFFDQYKPFPDGSGGTILTRQEHYNGVQVNGNSWVNCKVIDTGGLSIKKISDSKLLATYQSSEISTSTGKPACMAKFSGKKTTFMFYLTK